MKSITNISKGASPSNLDVQHLTLFPSTPIDFFRQYDIIILAKRKENRTNQKGNRMYIMVMDTETTGLEKCFCYDFGYVIVDTDTHEVVKREHYVVEQIWHNLALFESAYYKEKRPNYVQLMRARKAIMDKWGYIMRNVARDIRAYHITDAYAYNSTFDDKVISYNCDWYKCNNPFDTVAIHDIWGYASQFITNSPDYRAYCEEHSRFTDTGNYSGSAESVYQFISLEFDFVEAHMGLHDSEIEAAILLYCLDNGAKLGEDYKVNKVLPRLQEKPFTIKVNGQVIYTGLYIKSYKRNDTYNFTTIEGN